MDTAAEKQGSDAGRRSAGLDLLRIVSMLLVVVLHLLGRGGVLESVRPFSANYALAWGFETAAYCAVDCYAILTGFLLSRSRCRSGNLLGLWLQVFFYSAGITVFFALFRETVTPFRLLQAFFPVTFTQYWYFTAYFAVYCLAPFFNRLLDALSPEAFRRLVWTLFLLLSVLPAASGADPFVAARGYSFLWLAALYCLGAYLRAVPPRTRPARVWLLGYMLCTAAGLAFRLAEERLEFSRTGAAVHGGWLLSYTSPLVLGAAVCLFQACRTAELRGRAVRAVIRVLAPVSFGVYLLHAQPFVFHRILSGAAAPLAGLAPWRFCLAVPGAAVGIFLVCAAAEGLRRGLFRLLRLSTLTDAAGERLDRLLPRP